MASKSISDRGIGAACIVIERRAGGPVVSVRVSLDNGQAVVVELVGADLAAALTPAERTALVDSCQKLYAAALAAAGFSG